MTDAGGLLGHVEGLLAAGEWGAAALHVRHAAQQVSSRQAALKWQALCAGVPAGVRMQQGWPEALAWVGLRSGDLALVHEAVQADFPGRAVFLALLADAAGRWDEVLEVLDGAGEVPGLAGVLGGRLRAGALYELGDPAAEAAFGSVLEIASGRDQGLTWLDLAYYRSRARRDMAAREAYARAVVGLRGDAEQLTLAYANLGITCLRLNDVVAAELALREALVSAGRAGGERHRSTVWRVAGGAGMQRNLPARAVAAFERAREAALTVAERLQAVRGLGRALMAARQFDRALAEVYAGLVEVPGDRHPLWLDVAVLLLQAGNVVGAREALGRAQVQSLFDGWRRSVLKAEFLRLEGRAVPLDFLNPWPQDRNWVREEALLFPELFALAGVNAARRLPRGVVLADGPIRFLLDDVEVPLAPHRHAASLLAFLVAQGGGSTAERVLEAVKFPGSSARLQRQELSRAVRELRGVLGWPDSVQAVGGLLRLTLEIDWAALVYPPECRADLFCEGRLDPWVMDWRQANLSPLP